MLEYRQKTPHIDQRCSSEAKAGFLRLAARLKPCPSRVDEMASE
jgi:hypothetical protein